MRQAPEIAELVGAADIVLLAGHRPLLADAAQAPVVVDAGRWKPTMAPLLPRAQVIIASADFRVPGSETSEATARVLVDQGVPTVITTHGDAPVRWWHRCDHGAVQPPNVQAVDTLGAGDVFHGAYCFFACQAEADVPTSIERAAAVAALKCETPGPRGWLQRLPELGWHRRLRREE